MENTRNDFKEYRAELRYQYFNNNKYETKNEFYHQTEAIDYWDTNFFRRTSPMPCRPINMQNGTFDKFLKDESTNPTMNWTNMFNYLEALQKHPFFEYYRKTTGIERNAVFWDILYKYQAKLTRQLNNNQQLWV